MIDTVLSSAAIQGVGSQEVFLLKKIVENE